MILLALVDAGVAGAPGSRVSLLSFCGLAFGEGGGEGG